MPRRGICVLIKSGERVMVRFHVEKNVTLRRHTPRRRDENFSSLEDSVRKRRLITRGIVDGRRVVRFVMVVVILVYRIEEKKTYLMNEIISIEGNDEFSPNLESS